MLVLVLVGVGVVVVVAAAGVVVVVVVVVAVAVLVLCPWFCFGGQANGFIRGPCKRKIRIPGLGFLFIRDTTPAPGVLIYKRHAQKENI